VWLASKPKILYCAYFILIITVAKRMPLITPTSSFGRDRRLGLVLTASLSIKLRLAQPIYWFCKGVAALWECKRPHLHGIGK
jgi:hypothetical protein